MEIEKNFTKRRGRRPEPILNYEGSFIPSGFVVGLYLIWKLKVSLRVGCF